MATMDERLQSNLATAERRAAMTMGGPEERQLARDRLQRIGTRQRHALVTMALYGCPMHDAALEAGMEPKQFERLCREPVVQAFLRELTRDYAPARNTIALGALTVIASSPHAPAKDRISAARAILAMGGGDPTMAVQVVAQREAASVRQPVNVNIGIATAGPGQVIAPGIEIDLTPEPVAVPAVVDARARGAPPPGFETRQSVDDIEEEQL